MDSSKKENKDEKKDKKDKEAKEESNKNNETQEKDNSDKKNEEEFLKLILDNQNSQNDSNEQSFKISFALKNPPVSEGQSFCISDIQNIGQNNTQFTNDSLRTENSTQAQRTLNVLISQNKGNK